LFLYVYALAFIAPNVLRTAAVFSMAAVRC